MQFIALSRDNYRDLKILDKVMKVIERVLDSLIRSQVDTNRMVFDIMPCWGTTEAFCILQQLQEKHLCKHKRPYFAFVDLEKAFDGIPRKVLWWAMRRVGVGEWVILAVNTGSWRMGNTV